MTYKNQILFGRITRINAGEGTVSVKIEKDFTENIPEMESVFIEIEGKPVPFFISESEYSGGDLIKFRFDGYETYEKLKDFSGCLIFLTSEAESYKHAENSSDLTGFMIIKPDKSILGKVTEIIRNPGQDLLAVKSASGKEILIPFHEDFVKKIDPRKKFVVMNLPEGLDTIN